MKTSLRRFWKVFAGILSLAMISTGCGRPPAVEFTNLPLIASLRTACSARNEQWLTGVERAVTTRHNEGRMSPVEKAHFEKLIAQARGGDWQGAEKQCYYFERAQLNRTRQQPVETKQAHTHLHETKLQQVSVVGN
jgi:hypothetical protein